MTIGEFCNREVAIVAPDETVLNAANVMRQQHVGDVIVVEQRDKHAVPLGILTDRDIVIEILAKEVGLETISVSDVMSTDLLTARESDAIPNIVNQMRSKGVRRIPVVNEKGGLEGIFSLDDLLELLAEQLNDFVGVIHKETGQEQKHRA